MNIQTPTKFCCCIQGSVAVSMAAGVAVAFKLKSISAEHACVHVCRCRCRFTFRRFSGELWVEAERIIWFTCCRFEWGLELSPVQFLKKMQVYACRKHTYKLEIKPYCRLFVKCEHMLKRSQDPSQINPIQSL